MKRIYANSGFIWRMDASAVVIILAFIMGAWELWIALRSSDPGMGFLFAALFIGGGIYAGRQILGGDFTDTVVSLDADPAGESVVAVWRPFIAKKIAGKLSELSNWRFELKTVRANLRTPQLVADHPGHARPLRFELTRGAPVSPELRALAPDAVAAFENSLG